MFFKAHLQKSTDVQGRKLSILITSVSNKGYFPHSVLLSGVRSTLSLLLFINLPSDKPATPTLPSLLKGLEREKLFSTSPLTPPQAPYPWREPRADEG